MWLLSWPSCSRRVRCEGDLFFCRVAAFTGILRLMAWYTPRERSFSFPPKRYFNRHHLPQLGVQEKKAAAIKELNWFFLQLNGTYCGQTKRPELLFLNGFWPSWVFVRPSNGGGGGSRTPVREHSARSVYRRRSGLALTASVAPDQARRGESAGDNLTENPGEHQFPPA